MRRGYTLVEVSIVLALMALSAPFLLAAGHRMRDRAAVVSARERVAGLFAEARMAAMSWGGATVHVRADDGVAWFEAGGAVRRRLSLGEEPGVTVALPRGRAASDLAYDALGIGRVASETLTFRRGDAETVLVVSGYGRVRRW
jgi:prepilin-type N-terminal cleavage/methylation domain-containing protein